MTATIVALGGGGFSMNDGATALDRFMLEQSGLERPRVCFVPTASGDADGYISKFYDCFSVTDCARSHLPLFGRTAGDLREFVATCDVLYVGGGNTANLLALWRLHGLVEALQAEAARRHIVVGGMSAGAMCWFEAGLTDSFGPTLQPLTNALGWVAGSFCPHYDGDGDRRREYHAAVRRGALPPGIACDDGVAGHYVDGELRQCIGEVPGAGGYRVELAADGVVETALPVRLLTP